MKDKRVEYIDVLRGVTMILLFPRLLDKILPLDIKKYFFCSIVLGCLAGFCAGKLMKGGGLGFIMNLVLGLFGGLVGGWLFEQLGITWGGILGQLGTAIIGAVAILWVASLIKK